MSASNVAVALIDYLAEQLSVDTILGMPEIGRTPLELPMAAVTFQKSDYGKARARTLADPAPKGVTRDYALYVFAEHESQMLGYVDALEEIKATKSALTVDSVTYTLYWSSINRAEDMFAADLPIDFVIRLDIAVTVNK